MPEFPVVACLAVLEFSMNLCHAQTGVPASPPDEVPEAEGQALNC